MRLNQDDRYQLTSALWNDLKHFADIELLLFQMDQEPALIDVHIASNMMGNILISIAFLVLL